MTAIPCRNLSRLLFLILAFLPAAAFAALPPGVTKVTSVEGVDEYRLANGLNMLLFVDSTKPTTTVDVTYKVGSRQEDYGETGMAHLLEHMLFKGTPSVPSVFAELAGEGCSSTAPLRTIARPITRRSRRHPHRSTGY